MHFNSLPVSRGSKLIWIAKTKNADFYARKTQKLEPSIKARKAQTYFYVFFQYICIYFSIAGAMHKKKNCGPF